MTAKNITKTAIKSYSWLHIGLFSLILIALCLSTWTAIDVFLLKSDNQSLNESWLNARIALAAENKNLTNTLNRQQQQLNQLQLQLTNLSNADFNSKRNYALHQASYQLQLARLYVHFGNNPQRCIDLLKQSRQNILLSNTPELNSLQNNIATSIAAIKNHTNDKQKILLSLDDLANKISSLPTVPVSFRNNKTTNINKTKTHKAQRHWYQPLLTLFDNSKSLFIIRHYGSPITPALSQDQRQVIKQSLLLQLTLARWAVLTDNKKLYTQALQQAQKTLQQTFFFAQAITGYALDIKNLLKTPPNTSYSNIDSYTQQLSNYLQEQSSINGLDIINHQTKKSNKAKTK